MSGQGEPAAEPPRWENRICLIGNAPSSGSSLLADLLDSSPQSMCGRETSLFANRHLYRDYPGFAREPRSRSGCSSLYTKYIRTYFRGMEDYGLDESSLGELMRGCSGPREFLQRFRDVAIAYRGLPSSAVVFEKTPQNIACIGEYLDAFPGGRFVTIVRDPLYVYASLRRRQFTPLRAAGAWLFDVARYLRYRRHPRVIELRYEVLVERPYDEVAALLHRLTGERPDVGRLRALHLDNDRRELRNAGIGSWQFTSTKQIGSANTQVEPRYVQELAAWLDLRVSPAYALAHGLRQISLRRAMETFGYRESLQRLARERAPRYRLDEADRRFLREKYEQASPGRRVAWYQRWLLENPLWRWAL